MLPMNSCLSPLGSSLAHRQPSSLLDGLVAYWKLDETSGVRYDSHGAHHLNPTNGTVSQPGLHGNAASFNAAVWQPLSTPSTPDLCAGGAAFSMALWFRIETLPPIGGTTYNLVTKWQGSSEEYIVDYFRYPGTSALRFGGRLALGGYAFPEISTPITTDVWHLLYCYHDPGVGVIGLSLDNGPASTSSAAGGLVTTSAPLLFGAFNNSDRNYDGLLDEVGVWCRLLTTTERAYLYNGGVGRSYPFN